MASIQTRPHPSAQQPLPHFRFPAAGDVRTQIQQVLSHSNTQGSAPPAVDSVPMTAKVARLHVLVNEVASLETTALPDLLRHIESVPNRDHRCDLLSKLARHLPASRQRQIVETVLQEAPHITQPDVRARVLFRLFPMLDRIHNTPPASFMAVFDIARSIDNTEARTRSMIALSRYVPPEVMVDIQRTVLDTIDRMRSSTDRASVLASMVDHLAPTLATRALASANHIESPEERVRALTALSRALPPALMKQARDHAITTIENITGEERQVDALIAFAPYLEHAQSWDEFPLLLERALAIAVNIPRRQFRARALVALAPHLPPELQGEALAAVHSLPSEHDRANMLAELAPELPPQMLVASLAVAHTMRAVDDRTHALAALARHVPEHAREQTVLDALAAAQSLSHDFERVSALVDLLDILPEPLHQQALINALDATEHIRNASTQARALAMLSSHLPEGMVARALEIAQAMKDSQKQLTACMGLVERLPPPERDGLLGQMLATVRDIRYEYRQARALLGMAALLPPQMIPEAVDIAQTIDEPYDRLSALIALAQNSPPAKRPALVGEAWKLLKTVESGYDRASALATIAPLLPRAAEKDLTHAVGMAIGSIMDEYDQASAIILLAPLLAADRARQMAAGLPTKATLLRDALLAALATPDEMQRAALIADGTALWLDGIDRDDIRTRDALWHALLTGIAALPLPGAILCVGELLPLLRLYAGDAAAGELPGMLAV